MTVHPLAFEPDPEARAARRIAVAHRQVEMALEVAEAVQRRALAQIERDIAAAEAGEAGVADAAFTDAGPAKGRRDDPVAAVERAGRAVRLSLALAARLDSDEPVRRARVRSDAAAERQAAADAKRRADEERWRAAADEEADLQEIVVEAATRVLRRVCADEDEVREQIVEFCERMNEDEREFDVLERPVGAVLAALFETMEITPDWSAWAAEPWAVEEARTNAAGSPYAAGGAAWVREGGEDPPGGAPAADLVGAHGSSP